VPLHALCRLLHVLARVPASHAATPGSDQLRVVVCCPSGFVGKEVRLHSLCWLYDVLAREPAACATATAGRCTPLRVLVRLAPEAVVQQVQFRKVYWMLHLRRLGEDRSD